MNGRIVSVGICIIYNRDRKNFAQMCGSSICINYICLGATDTVVKSVRLHSKVLGHCHLRPKVYREL